MCRRLLIAAMLAGLGCALADAGTLAERWGVAGRLQHPGTLIYEPQKEGGSLMRFDLSALPNATPVSRARLFFFRESRHGSAFDIVPVRREGGLVPIGAPLEPAAPHYRWFDATAALQAALKANPKECLLWMRKEGGTWNVTASADSATGHQWGLETPGFDRNAVYLEIAYEGKPKDPPKQVGDIKAVSRAGQVFITFKEIEDYDAGNEKATWADLGKRFRSLDFDGPVPRDDAHEVRYRVYTHTEPITAATLGRAQLLCDVTPGSAYNTRMRKYSAAAVRFALEPGQPLPPGTGLYVHTVRRAGNAYYAVTSVLDGVENTADFSKANTAGPVAQRPAAPEPVLQWDKTSDLRGGGTYHDQWYVLWADRPLAPRPLYYNLAVGFCPDAMARPAPLSVHLGQFVSNRVEVPGPARRRGIVMSHEAEEPYHGLRMGVNNAEYTLEGVENGSWQPFFQRRQETIIRWIQSKWDVDEQRITCDVGSVGLWPITRGDLYSSISGWGLPDASTGFQAWHWANGVWGPPAAYKDKPKDQNPFLIQDFTRWVTEHPETELPYFNMYGQRSDHLSEQGWPPYPRFCHAMMDTKRAFCMHSRAVGEAAAQGIIDIRRDASLPAFANCSLDDNLGEGDLRSGSPYGQINGFLVWESKTIVDEPGLYQITVYLWGDAPLDECTVDITPRRCQRFKPKPGEKFNWTNTAVLDKTELGAGTGAADERGLVTVEKLKVTKAKQRITIQKK